MTLILIIAIVIIVGFGLFLLNNGISGAHFDDCKIIEYHGGYSTREYHPFTDENGVEQLHRYNSLWGYSNQVLSYENGWKRVLDTSNDWADLSFVGWQCDQWKEKLLQ